MRVLVCFIALQRNVLKGFEGHLKNKYIRDSPSDVVLAMHDVPSD